MATYEELNSLNGNVLSEPLRQKILVATAIKANVIAKQATPTAAGIAWAKSALSDPAQYLPLIYNYILAEYHAVPVATITAATDVQVQTAVDAAVDTLLGV